MSTVDPLEAALGGDSTPEPPAAGTPPQGAAQTTELDHPVLSRFGGDIAKALDAYDHLDREFGQQGQRLGQEIQALRGELDQLRQRDPEPPQNSGGMALPDMSVDQLTTWFEDDPAQATAYLIAQGQQMMLEQINATLDQRLKPVESQVGRSTATSLVDGLKKAVGEDVVARNADALVDLQRTDPAFFQGDPTVVFQRMKTAVLAADYEKGQRGASNGAATQTGKPADVAVMGGSGGRNPSDGGEALSPGDEFRQALISAQGQERDAFGNPKSR